MDGVLWTSFWTAWWTGEADSVLIAIPVQSLSNGRPGRAPRKVVGHDWYTLGMDEDGFPYEAKRRIVALVKTLTVLVQRDPEQEVQGMALPVLEAVLDEVKRVRSHDPVVAAVLGLISVEAISAGEPVRAADVLLVAEQLDAAIGKYPIVIA